MKWSVLAFAAFAAACSARAGESSSVADDAPDASSAVADAAVVADATPATAPPPPPVAVLTGRFENASPVCNDWRTEAATGLRSIPPRSGSYACKVCATGESPEASLLREATSVAAGRYVLTAYVRLRAGTPGPRAVRVVLESEGDVASSEPVVLRDDAYALATLATSAAEGATLRVRVVAASSPGACFFVDDVVLAREP